MLFKLSVLVKLLVLAFCTATASSTPLCADLDIADGEACAAACPGTGYSFAGTVLLGKVLVRCVCGTGAQVCTDDIPGRVCMVLGRVWTSHAEHCMKLNRGRRLIDQSASFLH
jgi:hypothetical protein